MQVHIFYSGEVQGVGFRYFVQRQALRMSLDGWVRNTADGAVELEAQGDARTIAAFIAALKQGPPLSRVDRVHNTEMPLHDGETGFRVRY